MCSGPANAVAVHAVSGGIGYVGQPRLPQAQHDRSADGGPGQKPDARACEKWLKCRAGWKEASDPQEVRYFGARHIDEERARESTDPESPWAGLLDDVPPPQPTRRRQLQ